MNKNLNLAEILKDCPKGTKLYSTIYGEESFSHINKNSLYPIRTFGHSYSLDGKLYSHYEGECILFPSKDQRDWSKFKIPIKKWSPTELQPFNKILVRNSESDPWGIDLFGFINENVVEGIGTYWNMVIPYNEETKHLLGTKHDALEKYKWWKE